jgi:hypothetical protein
MTLQKYFSHPSLAIYSYATPTHKTETGTANRWGTCKSKPPGPISMMGQSKNTDHQSDHIYYTLLWRCIELLRLSPATAHTMQLCWAKTIFLSQTGTFWLFLHPILLCGITFWAHPWRCSSMYSSVSSTFCSSLDVFLCPTWHENILRMWSCCS